MKSEETQIKGPRLEKPVRITEQVWPEGTVPVVSVFCITYNHVNFIRDAIEGFLMQETTFPVEIFVHDDASTDGTSKIVKDYAAKYPKLFWTILQKENQYSKERFKFFFDYLFQQRGEFIALCEGDDYWVSKDKLENQTNYLQDWPSCVASFHPATWIDEKNIFLQRFPHSDRCRDASFADMMCSDVFIPTCSFLFKRCALKNNIIDLISSCPVGDWPLFAYLADKGGICCLQEIYAVYRKHGTGVWTSLSEINAIEVKMKVLSKFLNFFSKPELIIAENEIKRLRLYRKELLHRDLVDRISHKQFCKALWALMRHLWCEPRFSPIPSSQIRRLVRSLLLPNAIN